MKKNVKRFLCGALSLLMASTLVTEHVLRMNAEGLKSSVTTSTATASFKNVTGQFDTTALRAENFNSSIQKAEEKKPTYETRTVMVTLSGATLAEKADGESVSSYVKTWDGRSVASALRKEQDAFLKKLDKTGIAYTLEDRYDTLLNAVAIKVNTKYVSTIKKLAGVESAVITTKYSEPEAVTSSAEVVENKTSVYGTGIYDSVDYTTENIEKGTKDYGKGTVVAILDTGLDYTHGAFQTAPSDPAWDRAYVQELLDKQGVTLAAEQRSAGISARDLYVSAKVPFAYDYADDDTDVYPSYSNHGTHVAGIIGGYDESGYTDKDGNDVWNDTDGDGVWDANENAIAFRGVVPNAQLVICKVFTDDLDDEDLGGAVPEDIVAALEDCVTLGVDVINMSLGTSCGFTTTNDGDDEGEMLNAVYENIKKAGISLVCAASNDYSAGYGGAYGTNLTTNPDSGTVGSPSTFASALSVASINGQQAPYMVGTDGEGNKTFAFYEESRDENGKPYDFAKQLLGEAEEKTFEFVVIPGKGEAEDYTRKTQQLMTDSSGQKRIALIERGGNTFQEKVEIAMEMGALAVIVYNNVAGVIRMNLGEIDNPIPAVSIDMDGGRALREMASGNPYDFYNTVGKITVSKNTSAGPFMSEFSSWGPTHDLKLKPEITAHGGEITSTVPGGYGEQSGTSMASPNMAGVMALIRSYVKENPALRALATGENGLDPVLVNRLANQLIMSTATTVYDQADRPYSPRKQGAGLGSLANVIDNTSAFLYTEKEEADNRPKLEIGDDAKRTGVYDNMAFALKNFGSTALSFRTEELVLTETVAKDGLAVAEQAYELSPKSVVWTVTGEGVTFANGVVKVAAGAVANIRVKIELSDGDKAYLEKENPDTGKRYFENGMYVEGFLKLLSADTEKQCDLSIPFLGFYGDWEAASMLDYDAYYLAEKQQDASILEEDKPQAQVWATQPYSIYFNEKYILPMGGYVYLIDEDNDQPVYTDEARNAISRYNEYFPDDEASNYMTSTGIKALYAGLLRNARVVTYRLTDVATGELILEDEINRVGKAYAGGGSAVPANVELELLPEEIGLYGNGKYRLDFDFYMNKPSEDDVYEDNPATKEIENVTNSKDSFSFTFTVDYEAPIVEDIRVRYYDYKEGTKQKQKIYLDIDVYDNHYAQALMLCYLEQNETQEEGVLKLVTDYPTPVRQVNENGTTTVSIEITDVYELGKQLYVQVDDYALNSCLYSVDLREANKGNQPFGGFALASGEENITIDIYEAHTVAFTTNGSFNRSNLVWRSENGRIAQVKNGEIVGLNAGTTRIFVSDYHNTEHMKTITVTVTENKKSLASVPALSFEAIKTSSESLQKPKEENNYSVSVNAGEEIRLNILKDPWYHPMTGLTFVWKTSDETVAAVDENGLVKTFKEGTATIDAVVCRNGVETVYSTSVTLYVEDEFNVSNYTLTDYNGIGYNEGNPADGTDILVIPTDMNIMYIGEDAFKDNTTVRRIVIPKSVVEIHESAFENCSALEEVYFVDVQHRVGADGSQTASIDWADLSLIHEKAFIDCTALKKVDFSNVKTITLAQQSFYNCTALEEVVDMQSIGTMYHYAFANCTALKKADITGLHVSGMGVFQNCTALTEIKTDKFTDIGERMFAGCTGLRNTLTLRAPKIGYAAFYGAENLQGIQFAPATDGSFIEFDIGAYAFAGCGETTGFAVDFNGQTVVSIGAYAFENTGLQSEKITLPEGLEKLGAYAFKDTEVQEIVLNDTLDFDALKLSGTAFEGMKISVSFNSQRYAQGTDLNGDEGVIYLLGANGVKTKILYVNGYQTGTLDLSDSTVVAIGEYAFAGSGVTDIVLPKGFGIEGLGEGAFADSALRGIDFNGVAFEEIPAYAFAETKISELALPASVKRIGAYAFAGSTLQKIYTEPTHGETELALREILYVGEGAFADTKALKNVVFTDGKWTGGVPFSSQFADGVFQRSGVETVVLPSLIATDSFRAFGDATFTGAESLKTVTLGAYTNTTGRYTFAGTPVKYIMTTGSITEIGDYSFYNCKELISYWFSGNYEVTVGVSAFENCEKLTKIESEQSLVTIGDRAFYNTRIQVKKGSTLELASVKTIGNEAFKAVGRENAFAVSMPQVTSIGDEAFINGGSTEIVLPLSIQHIGAGAFASSAQLTTIKFEDGSETNGVFFIRDSVLYRYTNKDKTEFELLAYPAAKEAAEEYVVLDGTVRIGAQAMRELNKGTLKKVVLPYTLRTIGDYAFHFNYVIYYTFNSIQAPVLETTYRQEVRDNIEAQADENTTAYYKGYYYINFDAQILNFTKYGNLNSYLSMTYPDNGVGYDSHIYRTYFRTRQKGGAQMTDETRACLELVRGLESAETVATWKYWTVNAQNTAKVKAFAEKVKTARGYYNNVVKDEAQLAFFTEEDTQKLLKVEEALREVKKAFHIPVSVVSVEYVAGSAKEAYIVGDTFDMKGLLVNVTYDDGSVVQVGADKLTLKTNKALASYDNQIEVVYEEGSVKKTAYIVIKVTDPNKESDEPVEKTNEEKTNILGIVLTVAGGVFLLAGGAISIPILYKRKQEKRSQKETFDGQENVEKAEETNTALTEMESDEETVQTAQDDGE